MKKILYILGLFALVTLVSCEDFLTKDSDSIFSQEYIFSSEQEVFKVLNEVYATNVYYWTAKAASSEVFHSNTDVEFFNVTSENASISSAYSYCPSAASGKETASWNYLYKGINEANDIIEGILASPLYAKADKNEKSLIIQYYGEAVTLRALFYLELVRIFGDVPYRRISAKADQDLVLGATDRDIILTDMINDVKGVEPMMYWASDLQYGVEVVSREFCQGLIARMALTRGGWSLRPDLNNPSDKGKMWRPDDWLDYYRIAEEYAGKAIASHKHSLTRSYTQLWDDVCNWITPNDDDNIFDIAVRKGEGNYGYWISVAIENPGANGFNQYGYASGGPRLNPLYPLSFDPKDLRIETEYAMYRYTKRLEMELNNALNPTTAKYNRLRCRVPLGDRSNIGSGMNYTYMRYADILLMYAEAANEVNNGPTAEAIECLKAVRRRAFDVSDYAEKVDAYVAAHSSKEEFFNAIVDERAWEFGGEKVRKYDLARWNLFSKKVYEMYYKMYEIGLTANDVAGCDPQYSNYPAKIWYKNGLPVPETWIKAATSYSDIVGVYDNIPDKTDDGYKAQAYCSTFVTQDKATLTWERAAFLKWSFAGFINPNNEDSVNPETDPVRYLNPIPADAIYRHKGKLQNYYGF